MYRFKANNDPVSVMQNVISTPLLFRFGDQAEPTYPLYPATHFISTTHCNGTFDDFGNISSVFLSTELCEKVGEHKPATRGDQDTGSRNLGPVSKISSLSFAVLSGVDF